MDGQENEQSEYRRLLQQIISMEKDSQKPSQAFIDLTEMFNSGETQPEHTYIDLLNVIDLVETGKEGQRIRAQKTSPATPSELIASGVMQASKASIVPGPENGEKRFEIPQRKAEQKPKIKVKFNEKDLVLPKLSIADQIAELERIIEGLKEHVFDESHMEVIMQEVYGLNAYIDRTSKDLKKRKITLNQTEQSLWSLRGQRVSEAMNMIEAGAS